MIACHSTPESKNETAHQRQLPVELLICAKLAPYIVSQHCNSVHICMSTDIKNGRFHEVNPLF